MKSRFACVLPEGYINENSNRGRGTAVIPNEQEACEVRGRGGESVRCADGE